MARGRLAWPGVPHLQDVAVAMDVSFPSVWMVASDGTLWALPNPTGGNPHQVAGPGRSARVAVSPDGSVWCVERNGALWIHRPGAGSWTKATPHRQSDGAAFTLSALDIAVGNDRRAWVVQDKGGGSGWFWSTVDGVTFAFGDAFGFKRISGGVSSDVWVVDIDGAVWKTSDRGNTFLKIGDGFVAITAGRHDGPWGCECGRKA